MNNVKIKNKNWPNFSKSVFYNGANNDFFSEK